MTKASSYGSITALDEPSAFRAAPRVLEPPRSVNSGCMHENVLFFICIYLGGIFVFLMGMDWHASENTTPSSILTLRNETQHHHRGHHKKHHDGNPNEIILQLCPGTFICTANQSNASAAAATPPRNQSFVDLQELDDAISVMKQKLALYTSPLHLSTLYQAIDDYTDRKYVIVNKASPHLAIDIPREHASPTTAKSSGWGFGQRSNASEHNDTSTTTPKPLQLWIRHGMKNQIFTFTTEQEIVNPFSGMKLDSEIFSLYLSDDPSKGRFQKWFLNSDGTIEHQASSWVLGMEGGYAVQGGKVELQEPTGNDHQKWIFVPIH